MSRPEYIARLHGAFYDPRTCELSERAAALQKYKEALAEAALISGCSELALKRALVRDYKVWLKQKRLPPSG